jgi:hypothetical protein
VAEGDVRVLGIAKGAGMIEPHMATLLVFLATNAGVDPPFLRRVLRDACDGSFNRVTIDGCMSTSDTAVIPRVERSRGRCAVGSWKRSPAWWPRSAGAAGNVRPGRGDRAGRDPKAGRDGPTPGTPRTRW